LPNINCWQNENAGNGLKKLGTTKSDDDLLKKSLPLFVVDRPFQAVSGSFVLLPVDACHFRESATV